MIKQYYSTEPYTRMTFKDTSFKTEKGIVRATQSELETRKEHGFHYSMSVLITLEMSG